jgi:hypothetical protein
MIAYVALKTSEVSIRTFGASVVDACVSDFPSRQLSASEQLSVDNEPSSHSGSESDADSVSGASRSAVFPFAVSHGIRVVFQNHRDAKAIS